MKSYLATIMLMIFSAVYASSAVADDTLKVVSYNVQVRPVLDDAGKLPEIGKRITDFDIVGIQELFVGAERLKNAAGGMNFRYFAPRRHIFKIVNSGLAVLSRYPVESTAQEYFQKEGSFENVLGSKGIFMTRIIIDGQVLDFYTTHLAAGREKDSGAARQSQTEQIIRFIQKHSPADHAVILTGDFNWKLNKLQDFTKIGLTHVVQTLKCPQEANIDHIFYRSGKNLNLTPQQWSVLKKPFQMPNGEYLSDHDPVLALFQIKTSGK